MWHPINIYSEISKTLQLFTGGGATLQLFTIPTYSKGGCFLVFLVCTFDG